VTRELDQVKKEVSVAIKLGAISICNTITPMEDLIKQTKVGNKRNSHPPLPPTTNNYQKRETPSGLYKPPLTKRSGSNSGLSKNLNADLKQEDRVLDKSPPKAKSKAGRQSNLINQEIELSKQLMEQKK
jgi:hypothetical protein